MDAEGISGDTENQNHCKTTVQSCCAQSTLLYHRKVPNKNAQFQKQLMTVDMEALILVRV